MSAATRIICRTLLVLICLSFDIASAGVINFENLPDAYFFNGGGQNIGSFYSGVAFGPSVTGLSVSRFGGYASDAFPPHSSDVVIWDAVDPTITISFASSIQSFGIWYTSFDPITLQAFDQGANLLGTVVGGPNTDGSTGATSFLMFSSPGIQAVTLTSSPGLFTLDDVTTTPEPNSFVLLASAFTGLIIFNGLRRASVVVVAVLLPLRSYTLEFLKTTTIRKSSNIAVCCGLDGLWGRNRNSGSGRTSRWHRRRDSL